MPDVFTRAKRSDVMSRIRSRGNERTELALVRVFRAHGITGWRRHRMIRSADFQIGPRRIGVRHSKGGVSGDGAAFRVRPDFVFPKSRVAVFVDGCFWHGCPQHATKPRNNAAFWRKKFAANTRRDQLVTRTLRKDGWRVLRIWEHELARKNEVRLLARLRRIFGP